MRVLLESQTSSILESAEVPQNFILVRPATEHLWYKVQIQFRDHEESESALTCYNSGFFIWKGLVDMKVDFCRRSLHQWLKTSVSVR